MAVECELMVEVSFPLEDEAMIEDESVKDALLQQYMSFSEEFAAAGSGQCGPPLILLPRIVKSDEGVEMFIPGTFKFNCDVTLSQVETALGQIRGSFTDMNPKPYISVNLYAREGRTRIRLYPNNDIENYLSGTS